jgi:hypothetical protein
VSSRRPTSKEEPYDKSGQTKRTVVARLVDAKDPGRERTVTAWASPPTTIRVSVATGRVRGSSGGHWSLDGKQPPGDMSGHGLLLQAILEHAATLDAPPKVGPE